MSEKIGQLKLLAADGKKYKSDMAITDQLFHLIQSIPLPKVEPFKLWMAQVANERLDQLQNPDQMSHSNLPADDVEWCYLFIKRADGKEAPDSRFLEVN